MSDAAANDPRLTPLAASLPASVPFVGPEAAERARGQPFAARIGANESVFGPSPKVIAAMERAASQVWMYGDPESHDLRHALARHHGVPAGNVAVGEGIDSLLGLLVRLLISPGDTVVTSLGAYPTFNYHVAGFGGRLVRVPYRDDAEDLGALVTAAREARAKIIYCANPDNPMGSALSADTAAAAIAAVPGGSILALDEAYLEFAPEGTAPPLDPDDARVIRFRTFSKAYGMAGARVGYAIGPKSLIAAFDRVRNHFGMGRISQAGALAALADGAWLAHVVEEVRAARETIGAIVRANGLRPLPSATNFVAVDCGVDGALAARVVAELGRRGVFVRMPFAPPQDRCIRITCGRAAEIAALAAALPDSLASARQAQVGAERSSGPRRSG